MWFASIVSFAHDWVQSQPFVSDNTTPLALLLGFNGSSSLWGNIAGGILSSTSDAIIVRIIISVLNCD